MHSTATNTTDTTHDTEQSLFFPDQCIYAYCTWSPYSFVVARKSLLPIHNDATESYGPPQRQWFMNADQNAMGFNIAAACGQLESGS